MRRSSLHLDSDVRQAVRFLNPETNRLFAYSELALVATMLARYAGGFAVRR